jgi:pilus assembly protein CpaB
MKGNQPVAIYSEGTLGKSSLRRPDGASRGVRARAIIFTIIALGAGSSSAWMVLRYVRGHAGTGSAVAVSKVVVATVDIPVGTKVTPDMLKVVDWPTSAQPQGSFEAPGALGDRVVSTALVAGEPVVEARLSPKGSGAGMASLIPANMRAMTVTVNDVIGVGGFIHPGDIVDVITTMQGPALPGTASSSMQDQFRSKIVLQGIRVLAVGQRLASDNNKPETVPAVTLLVSPEESERLALASTQGKLQLTMRSQIDKEELETPGVSPPELLGFARPAAPVPAAAPPMQRARAAAPAHPAPTVAAAPAEHPVEVVEVLHGDREEKRKLTAKAVP